MLLYAFLRGWRQWLALDLLIGLNRLFLYQLTRLERALFASS